MANARSLSAIILGAIVTVLAVYWSINPLSFFDSLCISQPCGMNLVFAGVLFVIGIAVLVGGIVSFVRSHKAQTMVISMGSDAENDADAVSSIQTSVESGENADEKLEDNEEYKPRDGDFLELPGDGTPKAASESAEPVAATPATTGDVAVKAEKPAAKKAAPKAKAPAKKPVKAPAKKAPVKKAVKKKK